MLRRVQDPNPFILRNSLQYKELVSNKPGMPTHCLHPVKEKRPPVRPGNGLPVGVAKVPVGTFANVKALLHLQWPGAKKRDLIFAPV
jgi:hypothetical protein